MTEDPKAPGAAAVYLNYTEEDNDPIHYQAIYARIKILTEKGKDLAIVDIPYMNRNYKITDIKGRTIHSDGTVIPFEGKPEDLLTAERGEQRFSRKVFTLPKVEVGSIIEYRYQIRYDDGMYSTPDWYIQGKYYVHKAHYSFIPFEAYQPGPKGRQGTSRYLTDGKGRSVNSLIWWMNLPKGVEVKGDIGGRYLVDVEDIPPAPDEEYMPPVQSLLYKVHFYYMPSFTAQEFWSSEAKDWVKENDHFAQASGALRTVVSQLVAATDTPKDKARKLYAAVQALDNTDYSRKLSETEKKQLKLKEVKRAEDVWNQKRGNSEEIALLYLGMVRAAGLKAHAVKIVARNRAIFDFSYMSLSQLDDTLIDLELGTERLLVDPGEKMCPFGTVNWRHSGVKGLAEADAGPSLMTTPELSFKENTTSRRAFLTLDEHSGVKGTIQYIMSGQTALRWRQTALRNDQAELKKLFDKMLESQVPQGVEAHVDHFVGIDTPDSNLIGIINVEGKMGSATAKRMMLPGMFFQARGHQPFVEQAKRTQPVDMEYAEQTVDQVDYKLPAGYTVEGGPKDDSLSWKSHAVLIVKSESQKSGTYSVARRLARAFSSAKPEEYQELRGFYQKVAAVDQQQIVLAAPAQGGN